MDRETIHRLHEADPYFATTLAKGMLLLQAYAPSGGWLGNKTLVERTGLSKAAVTRLAKTLTQLGYLRHDPERSKYCLDVGVLELVNPFLSQLSIRRIARPWMQQLANEVHGAVSLGMPRRSEMVLIESCLDNAALTARPDVGSSRDMASSSIGRAFLGALDENRRLKYYQEIQRDMPAGWAETRRAMDSEVARYRQYGYALSLGEDRRFLNAVGVAIQVPGQDLPFSFNCVVADSTMPARQFEKSVPQRLLSLVETVRQSLGPA